MIVVNFSTHQKSPGTNTTSVHGARDGLSCSVCLAYIQERSMEKKIKTEGRRRAAPCHPRIIHDTRVLRSSDNMTDTDEW